MTAEHIEGCRCDSHALPPRETPRRMIVDTPNSRHSNNAMFGNPGSVSNVTDSCGSSAQWKWIHRPETQQRLIESLKLRAYNMPIIVRYPRRRVKWYGVADPTHNRYRDAKPSKAPDGRVTKLLSERSLFTMHPIHENRAVRRAERQ